MGLGAIFKGIGAMDRMAGKMGADSTAKKMADAMFNKDKWKSASSKIFETVDGVADGEKSADGLMQQIAGFKMRKGAAYGIGGALTVYGVGDTMLQSGNGQKLGAIEAGKLANTLGSESSPGIGTTLDRIDSDEKYKKDFQKHNLPIDSYGAEGDLVFALHGLR